MHTLRENGSEVDCTLIYPVEKLELSLKKNQVYRGELEFEVKPRCEISGFLYADHYRMQCVQENFRGDRVKLAYCFDAKGLEEGEQVKGYFSLVTEIGEYYLPFEVTVKQTILETSLGEMRNLFHFVNLARTNWEEAVSVFYKPEFIQLFGGSDRQYKNAYRGLSAYLGNEANVEEFLVLLRKKQPVTYELNETEKEQSFQILKNSWGYTRIELHTDADFIELEKDVIKEQDFVGNQTMISYKICKEKLHAGKNYGIIYLESGVESYTHQVCVEIEKPLSYQRTDFWDMKKLTMQLMDEYIHFETKQAKRDVWLENSERIVEQMTQISSRNLSARLFQAQILIITKRENEAKWVLKHIADLLERDSLSDSERYYGDEDPEEVYAYYLFLSSMLMKEEAEKKQALREVETLFSKKKNSFRISWILLYMDEERRKDGIRKLQMMEGMFQKGINSPLLYLEVAKIYQENPAYLSTLDGMELQTMRFCAKYQILTEELIRQVNYFAGKCRTFSKPVYELLVDSYSLAEKDETLQTICTLLIKGGKTDNQYFRWYELAVEKELRITRLYDYYLLSIDRNRVEPLPKMVLLYFSYQCDLDYHHAAYLYANVVRHEKEMADIYQKYVEQIEHFVYKQVLAGHLSEDLIYLYKKIIVDRMVDAKFAAALVELLFMHQVKVLEEKVKYVILIEGKRRQERRIAVVDREAVFPVYDEEEYVILLETDQGNRYIQSISYEDKELFLKQRLLQMIQKHIPTHPGLDLFYCENNSDFSLLDEAGMERVNQAYRDTNWTEDYRKILGIKLVHFYFDQNLMEGLDAMMSYLVPEQINQKQRGELVKILILRDQFKRACEVLEEYGFEGVSMKYLLLLFQYASQTKTLTEEKILALANYLFQKGKADREVLSYLAEHYEGNAKQMRNVWEKVRAYDIPAIKLAEKIIAQTLMSDAYVANRQEVFQYYYGQGGNAAIVEHYLSKCAYQYFVKEEVMDENIFAIMLEMEEASDICKLAIVRFFAEHARNMSIQERVMVKNDVKSLIAKDIYFPFFNQFADLVPELLTAFEKTYIEYKTPKKAKVILHYITSEDGENAYHKEELKEVYEGYFYKSFVLFFGERLQYYITEIVGETEMLTESRTIEKGDLLDSATESRFNLLNHIVACETLEEYESVESLSREYAQKSFLADRLFEIR